MRTTPTSAASAGCLARLSRNAPQQPFTADNGLSAGRSRNRRVEQPDDLARNNTYGGSHWHRPMDVLWADTAFDAVSLPCRTSRHAAVEGRVIMGAMPHV